MEPEGDESSGAAARARAAASIADAAVPNADAREDHPPPRSESLGTADTSSGSDASMRQRTPESDDEEEDELSESMTTTPSDDLSDESDDEESVSDDDDDDDSDDDDDLLSSVAPEPQTDDSGDEAALLALDGGSDGGEEREITATARRRRSANEGAGEGGRGGYTTGGAALHPHARAASSHFQAADALACGPAADLSCYGYEEEEGGEEGEEEGEKKHPLLRFPPSPGEEDVVLVDRAMVSVWRLPPRGDGPPRRRGGPLSSSSPSSSSPSPPRPLPVNSAAFSGGDRDAGPSSYAVPTLLARATYHEIEPYSVARSSDGKTIAIGGDLGLVAFLELEACPRAVGRECALCSAADAAREQARRQRLLERMQAALQRDWEASRTSFYLSGLPPPPPPRQLTLADVDEELREAEEAEAEVDEASGERRERRQRSPPLSSSSAVTPPAHLRPAAVVTLGSLTAVANNNMINGVRFGPVGGKERLVAAVQDRYVYFVDLPPRRRDGGGGGGGGGWGRGSARFAAPPPPPPPGSGAVAEALRVVDLTDPNEVHFEAEEAAAAEDAAAERGAGSTVTPAPSPSFSPRPLAPPASTSALPQQRIAPPRTRKLDVYVPSSSDSSLEVVPDGRTRTAVAGPFPRAANLALPSPDGRLVAVVGDFDGAWVLRARQPAPAARGGKGGGAAGAAAEAATAAPTTAVRPGTAPTPPLTRVRRSASAARLASGLRPHPYDATTALRLPFGVASPARVICHRGGGSGGTSGANNVNGGGDQTQNPNRNVHDVVVDVGSQYCAWSPDSSLLAATSDALRAAFVWHVPRGQPLFRVEACGRAALAAAFAPLGFPATFAFAEAARRAFVADLRCGAAGFAKLPPIAGFGGGGSSARGASEDEEREANDGTHHRRRRRHSPRRNHSPPSLSFPRPLSRVCGFGITPSGRVLAATRAGLAEWRLSEGWSPSCHADAPPAFKRAARALLCVGATRRESRSVEGAGPWSLPTDVLLSIIEMAAQPRGVWVGVGPGGERRALPVSAPYPNPTAAAAPPSSPQRQQREPRPVVRLLAPAGGTTYAAVVAMRAPPSTGGGLGNSSAAAARAAAAEAAAHASAAAGGEEPSDWFSR